MIKLLLSIYLLLSCNKTEVEKKPTYDSSGKQTKECSIRAADGSGPYVSLGRKNAIECEQIISKYCNRNRYKQVHRNKGHFARGKFGVKIMIGTCP